MANKKFLDEEMLDDEQLEQIAGGYPVDPRKIIIVMDSKENQKPDILGAGMK